MALNNLRSADKWMSIVSAILLAGYLAFSLYALASPSNDPQRGMATGFIVLVVFTLLALGGILWFGVARTHPWVVRIVFFVTAFPALSQMAQEVFLFMHRGQ
jgi:hypothetical protein